MCKCAKRGHDAPARDKGSLEARKPLLLRPSRAVPLGWSDATHADVLELHVLIHTN